jgi:pyruvate dehydrogenase E2 component (dihydrolipoamide acetyltransferase)
MIGNHITLDAWESLAIRRSITTTIKGPYPMPIELKMPALSPTMEEGTLARWLVKEGDKVSSGDLLAEIETDKATMEFEAVDEGIVTKILVAEGTDGVKVGAVIAMIQGEDDQGAVDKGDAQPLPLAGGEQVVSTPQPVKPTIKTPLPQAGGAGGGPATPQSHDRVKASPLAKRIAGNKGLDLTTISGTGPNGRIVKADVEAISGEGRSAVVAELDRGIRRETPAPTQAIDTDINHNRARLDHITGNHFGFASSNY